MDPLATDVNIQSTTSAPFQGALAGERGPEPALTAEAPQLKRVLSDVCSALRLRAGFRFNPGGAGVGRG